MKNEEELENPGLTFANSIVQEATMMTGKTKRAITLENCH